MQKDNTTLNLKVALRRNLMAELAERQVELFVMETHGGVGKVWERCYRQCSGVVFEKDSGKAEVLAQQRPAWAVYEGDCIAALTSGVGFHRTVTLLDVDPYGEPWPVLDAFFVGSHSETPTLGIAVNDGLRQKVNIGGGWDVASLQGIVGRRGSLWVKTHYLEACRELLEEKAANAGYALARWAGYYCGRGQQMTHYAAILRHSP